MTRASLFECLLLAAGVAAFGVWACLLGPPVSAVVAVTAAVLCGFAGLAWQRFDAGMHPVFPFLALFVLFQGGRLLASLLPGLPFDPLAVDLASPSFTLGDAEQRTTLFALVLSAASIYLPHRLFDLRLRYSPPFAAWLSPYLLVIFLLSFPFHVYKNYEYLSYVRSHGGYLAIFTSQEHLAEVGVGVRAASQLCSAAFVAYFALETPRTRLWWITAAFSATSVMELLIGLRGKVLLFLVGLLFLANLKRGARFHAKGLLALALALMVIAETTAIFRENKAESFDASTALQTLLTTQGVSIDVLESVVAYRPVFGSHRLEYVEHGLALGFGELERQNRNFGSVFEDDLSFFLNPSAFKLGFGTGGSFVAEGYLLAGLGGVILESLLASALLALCARKMGGFALPFAWTAATALWYLPRQSMAIALSGAVKACASLALVFVLAHALHKLRAGLGRLQPHTANLLAAGRLP